ncbi:acylphosphatase [Candidatus Parcubacteria bacterium]|nr:acylphosphatase [Candidatus Parcubacteria bacterium]
MTKRLECEVEGRVQLVMYRDFARRKAKPLGITGTVENLSNGNVYVVAEGEEATLRRYLEDLKKGPLFSKVTEVREKWLEPTKEFKDFSIIFYGRR